MRDAGTAARPPLGAPPRSASPWQRLYAGAHLLRWAWYRRRARRLPRPVISIGNLHWGGGGKTPLVSAVAGHLRARGMAVCILSRGYGATGGGGGKGGRGGEGRGVGRGDGPVPAPAEARHDPPLPPRPPPRVPRGGRRARRPCRGRAARRGGPRAPGSCWPAPPPDGGAWPPRSASWTSPSWASGASGPTTPPRRRAWTGSRRRPGPAARRPCWSRP